MENKIKNIFDEIISKEEIIYHIFLQEKDLEKNIKRGI